MAQVKKVKIPKEGFRIHPSAEVFPMMSPKELNELKASIDEKGLLESIVVINDQILDGRNRYKALQELGEAEDPIHFVDLSSRFDVPCEEWTETIDYVVMKNLCRRHLTAGQKSEAAVAIAKRKKIEAGDRKQRARERWGKRDLAIEAINDPENAGLSNCEIAEKIGVSEGTVRNAKDSQNMADHSPGHFTNEAEPQDTGEARDQAGAMVGISGRTVDDAKKVFDSENATEELQNAVRQGDIGVRNAAAIVSEPPNVQRDAVAEGKKGVAEAAKQVRHRKQQQQQFNVEQCLDELTSAIEAKVSQWPVDQLGKAVDRLEEIAAQVRQRSETAPSSKAA